MSDLISRQEAYETLSEYYHHRTEIQHKGLREALDRVPSAEPVRMKDSVPWEFLERYAEWFCALVSYPEFIREAKRFYEDTYKAELGGNIDDSK